jgi:hypothetical protein
VLPDYGVVIGTYDHSGAHQGQWLHEVLYIVADGTTYECAVDVNEPTGIFQYQILTNLDAGTFSPISSLSDGYHQLPRTATSGAMDYIRSPLLQAKEGRAAFIVGFFKKLSGAQLSAWHNVTGNEAGNDLVQMVINSTHLYIFGAPYADPHPNPGMHDIHMNQGDPINSQFHALDGIWQDGCVIAQDGNGQFSAYLGKFASQSLNTDSNGYPV